MFTVPLEIDTELMKANINSLVTQIDQELKKTEKRQRQLKVAKLDLQAICEHEFETDPKTHGATFETCKICGYNQRQ